MPGLRLGYAVSANEALLRKLRSRLQPWNTSIPAQMAGIAALKDPDYLEKTRTLLAKEKEYLTRELNNGLVDQLYASSANYLFFHSRTDLKERLLEKNILIRSCSNYRNLQEGFFRIGIRTREENEQLILRWRDIF
jgi:threonine-phosphate decarboxylase